MTEEEYVSERLDNQIDWYSRKSSSCQTRYKALRLVEIIAAALIPFLSGMGEKIPGGQWIVGALGVMIALAAAAGSLFKYHENWIQYRVTSEQLKHEKFLFATRSGPYADQERFQSLVQRVESLISKEAATWAQVTKQPAKVAQGV
ncbi:DUF4231 domain-containing protein [Zoogloea sp.]|uniref:DUF4231 domain-containing protein n=1 Tax=Zoogloea sp. TaxID=49181 RepID=UPI0035AE2196